ncbi:MAG: hypothetical protein AB8G05_09025 [Oligoflexales bacterium]
MALMKWNEHSDNYTTQDEAADAEIQMPMWKADESPILALTDSIVNGSLRCGSTLKLSMLSKTKVAHDR